MGSVLRALGPMPVPGEYRVRSTWRMLHKLQRTHEEPQSTDIRAPLTHDWVAMNLAASLPVHDPAPVADRKRVPLLQAAKDSDTASGSILDRILSSGDKQRVEVASFQSSI